MAQGVEAVLPVVVAHPGRSSTPERHRLDKEVDVHLVYCATAEGKTANKPVDGLLVAAEHKAREWKRCCSHSCERLVKGFVGENRQNRAEYFLFHNLVVPAHRIEDRWVEVRRLRVRLASRHHLGWVDHSSHPCHRFTIDDTRVVGVAPGVVTVEFEQRLLCLGYERLGDR